MNIDMIPAHEVAKFQSGGTPDRNRADYYSGTIPWITGADIDEIGTISPRYNITKKAIEESSTGVADQGDLLIVTRTSLGKTAIVADGPVCFSQDITALHPDDNRLDIRYLWHYIRSQERYFASRARGATIKGVTRDVIRQMGIPLTSLKNQRSVAQLLDRVDSLRIQRREAIALLDELVESIFLDMFGDAANNPKGLPVRPLKEAVRVKSGSFLPASAMTGGDYPVYGGNGISGYHNDYTFERAHIAIGRVGAYCGVVHFTEPKSWITDNSLYVNDVADDLDPEYLYWALHFANLNRCASKSAQPLISGTRIKDVPLVVPPMELQEQFIKYANKLSGMRSRHGSHRAELDALFASLQDRAFRGELWTEESAPVP